MRKSSLTGMLAELKLLILKENWPPSREKADSSILISKRMNHSLSLIYLPLFAIVSLCLITPLHALSNEEPGTPKIEGTANEEDVDVVEAEKALLATITYPKGMTAKVFARDPDVLNATAISIDEQNRLFVAETHRFDRGIEDNRRNWHWIKDEVGLRTTAERLELYKKYADKKPMDYYTKYAEKIRVLEDKDGDGVAEKSWLYADGFNDPLDGTAAGIMAYNGKVYFACIPHVWMLEDKDGDGVSDGRTSLQEGYGISVSLSGHDLNGFALGPDGRIYFTIGDRGYDLKTKEGKHLYDQYGGAIFRMEPDGSNLEVVHYNLRNPKEIAFDQYGVAFSVDNNCDYGDKARLVMMVEGAMSGWNRGNQNFRNFPDSLGLPWGGRHDSPWMSELWWEMDAKNRPEAILPPIAHVSVGPSGLAYNPGIGLAEKWDNHFFVCDYRGGGSETIGFKVEPKGASYEMVNDESFVKGFLNTDIEFGYDGKVYISDFTGGWKTYEFGTIFVFEDPKETAKPEVAEVKTLFAQGFDQRPPEELVKLLKHQDLRVRQRAQFALAAKISNRGYLMEVANNKAHALTTRLHGLWGLGQLARLHKDAQALSALIELTRDEHWRLRGQAAQALGDTKISSSRESLIALLSDKNLNVRMLAATALGKVGKTEDVAHLIKVLEGNTASDDYLRHGAIHGLRLIVEATGTSEELMKFKQHEHKEVRLGLIIALRHLRDPNIAYFLNDKDPALVTETIQAINDNYIIGARAKLATMTPLLGKFGKTIDYRIINAVFRISDPNGALKLMELAENSELPEDTRVECLFQLRRWEKPHKADHTTGKIRPIRGDRNIDAHKDAIKQGLIRLFQNSSGEVLAEALTTGNHFDVAPKIETQREQFLNEDNLRKVRLATLKTLLKQKDPELVKMLSTTVKSKDSEIRKASLMELAKASPEYALQECKRMLAGKDVYDGQLAMQVMAGIPGKESDEVIKDALINISRAPLGIQLDILEAAQKRQEPEIKSALKTYQDSLDKNDPLAEFRVTLAGGNPTAGKRVFYRHGAAQCQRCHIAEKGRDGGVAGPNLGATNKPYEMEYLLESLIVPNARISPGFGMVSVTKMDGSIAAGMLLEDGKDSVALSDPATQERVEYNRREIKSMTTAMSTMPPMGAILKKSEMRDVMAYLHELSLKK